MQAAWEETNFARFFQDSAIPMHEIEPGLYLGSLDAAKNYQLLKDNNITHVLAILDTFRYMQNFEGIRYHQIELPDSTQAALVPHLPGALSFIAQARRSNQNVLVHCAAGVSRSASFVIAYIMVKYNYPFDQAKEIVKQKRGCVWPNTGFQRQLTAMNVEEYRKYLN
ncbi:hypothetical protein SteCoe_11454 [Stentor coeruleus]|uniref:protein-tyrosine-phosphatase n=1 Tax=Stentor coeruleus TaxID=5963 RepID=A0A1R2CD49_9CILI|nr:hypothetical protein SteCoe_11454 [Stentor coeruleus]